MITGFIQLAVLGCLAMAETDDKKWVWSSARKSGGERVYTGAVGTGVGSTKALIAPSESLFKPAISGELIVPQSTRLRYEVSDPESTDLTVRTTNGFPQEQLRPPRPNNVRADSFNINNNRPIRPTGSFSADSYRPTDLHRPSNRPNGGYRPDDINYRPGQGSGYRPTQGSGIGLTNGPNGRPVLAGPKPSWDNPDPHRYQDYDRCKCVHSFNCNSPGIQFGSCDADKKYCCYKDDYNNQNFNNFNYRPHVNRPSGDYQGSRPVLAGPNGPRDRPDFYRPNYNNADRYDSFENNRNGYRGVEDSLEEAYKRGLESAIKETVHVLTGIDLTRDRDYRRDRDFLSDRDFSQNGDYRVDSLDDFNRRPTHGGKYGLHQQGNFYGGRSTNSTIFAETNGKPLKI